VKKNNKFYLSIIALSCFFLGQFYLWSMEKPELDKEQKKRLFDLLANYRELGFCSVVPLDMTCPEDIKKMVPFENVKIRFCKIAFLLHPDRWNSNWRMFGQDENMRQLFTRQFVDQQFNRFANAYENVTGESREVYSDSFQALLDEDEGFTDEELVGVCGLPVDGEQIKSLNESWDTYKKALQDSGYYKKFAGYKRFLGVAYAKEYQFTKMPGKNGVDHSHQNGFHPTQRNGFHSEKEESERIETNYLLRTKVAFGAVGVLSAVSLAALGCCLYYKPSMQDIQIGIADWIERVKIYYSTPIEVTN
jgi:hypothetical protein